MSQVSPVYDVTSSESPNDFDSGLLPRENRPYACIRPIPSRHNGPVGLTPMSDSSFCFQCKLGFRPSAAATHRDQPAFQLSGRCDVGRAATGWLKMLRNAERHQTP